jgi:hypothetical protein
VPLVGGVSPGLCPRPSEEQSPEAAGNGGTRRLSIQYESQPRRRDLHAPSCRRGYQVRLSSRSKMTRRVRSNSLSLSLLVYGAPLAAALMARQRPLNIRKRRRRRLTEVGGPHGVRFRCCAAHAYLCPAVTDRRTASGAPKRTGTSGRTLMSASLWQAVMK